MVYKSLLNPSENTAILWVYHGRINYFLTRNYRNCKCCFSRYIPKFKMSLFSFGLIGFMVAIVVLTYVATRKVKDD